VTWGSGTAGVSGAVSEANSLVGSSPNDYVGFDVTALSNGNYLVNSPRWNGSRGAVTWGSGTTGQTLDGRDTVTPQNSLVGSAPNAGLGTVTLLSPDGGSFLAPFSTDGGGRVTVGLTDPSLLTYARAEGLTLTITPDFLTSTLNTGTAVVLQASNDITVNDPIVVSADGHGGALTLQAGRSILLNASITTDNGALTLIANDRLASGVVDADRGPGPAVIAMACGTTLDAGSGALTVELRDGAGLTNPDSGAITLQAVVAGSISVQNNGPSAGSDVVLGPVTTAGPQSYSSANGTTLVTADLAAGGSTIAFSGAVFLSAGVALGAGGDAVTFADGTVVPDTGLVSAGGGLALSSGVTFLASLNGAGAGDYSQVEASGMVDLGGSTLLLQLGYVPAVGDSFTLLTTEDPAGITGTFAGLDEGATFEQGGLTFQITYQGGPAGNSVVLTRIA
jgi:hypothetical protein